ncbi:hypothetical protein, partial [Novosphingobium sp. B-7]
QGLWWHEGGAWHTLATPRALPANIAIGGDGRAIVAFRGPAPRGADLPFVAISPAQLQVDGIEGLLPSPLD